MEVAEVSIQVLIKGEGQSLGRMCLIPGSIWQETESSVDKQAQHWGAEWSADRQAQYWASDSWEIRAFEQRQLMQGLPLASGCTFCLIQSPPTRLSETTGDLGCYTSI